MSGSIRIPAHSGVEAKSVPCSGSQIPWSQMISMNIRPPREIAERKLDRTPNVKARMRKRPSWNIGALERNSTTAKTASNAPPARRQTSTTGEVQPIGWPPYGRIPYVIPIITSTSPAANVRLPGQSIGSRVRTPISRRLRYDQTVPTIPAGTETRKTSRHEIGASSPPSTRPMNMPLMPTTLLIPSARPRWFSGKASVRMATELATRKAAPTPCTIRKEMSQSAPARPWSQSIVSSSDATV